MSLKLTPKQKKILLLIRDGQLTRGYSPTLQELADELNVSKVTIFEHVGALEKKGALIRDPNKARSLELSDNAVLPDESRPTRLPLVGTIAAGLPIEAIEDRRTLDLEELFGEPRSGRTGDTFVLEVRGDSMIDEHIREGDYVICRRTNQAHNGDTVVALLEDGEATLKKFYREKGRVRLQPANEKYEPIIVPDCQIQGIVIGVVRAYG
ncbi:MAG: transcriptional repressor LexA [Planctomycetes bacterium]|nr:transcriptional repressor LexA [Planctomycetota bacterium]